MSTITRDHIDAMYDATELMGLLCQILSHGDISDKTASQMSWLIGSSKTRLISVLDLLEHVQGEQERIDRDAPATEGDLLQLGDDLAALSDRFDRIKANIGGRSE